MKSFSWLHKHLKILRLALHLLRGLGICFFLFPWLKKESQKCHIQCWSQQLLAIFNVQINTNLTTLPSHSLIIANHISWLDIFVINSVTPCCFVAKSDIRSWPLFGWLAECAGTIYISRGKKSDVKRIYHHLIDQIKTGEHIVFFPEGTCSAQGRVLPFHANLFEAAIQANAPLQPLALRYVNSAGNLLSSVEFTNEVSLGKCLFNIANESGIIVELLGLDCITTTGIQRRELANTAWKVMTTVLHKN